MSANSDELRKMGANRPRFTKQKHTKEGVSPDKLIV